jgi:hypothetical protein
MNAQLRTWPHAIGLMATRNRHSMVPRAVRAFFAQRYDGPKTLFVYDDSDTPLQLPVELIAQGVIIVRHKPLHLGVKRNRMLAHATIYDPDAIFFVWDDDDYYGPMRIARQVEALIENPDADACLFCPLLVFNTVSQRLFRAKHADVDGMRLRVGADGTMALRRRLWERLPLDETTCVDGVNEGWRWLAEPHDRVIAIPGELDYVVVRHGGNVTWNVVPVEPSDLRFWDHVTDATHKTVTQLLARYGL